MLVNLCAFALEYAHENMSTLDTCHVESLVSMVYLDCVAAVSTEIAKGIVKSNEKGKMDLLLVPLSSDQVLSLSQPYKPGNRSNYHLSHESRSHQQYD